MDIIAFFRRAFLRHGPLRHAQMLPPDRNQKYIDHAYPLTDKQIRAHLRGTWTFAAPAAHADMGCLIAFDVDGGGLAAIQALLAAAAALGCFAFGQYCPRDGWAEDDQRGYVWLVFDTLTHIKRLEAFGERIRRMAGLTKATVELRTHHGDTRLPLGKHTHTGRFGVLVLQDGGQCEIDPQPRHALKTLMACSRENAVDLLPDVTPVHERSAPLPSPTYGTDDIIRIYNERTCIRGLILHYGGKRSSYTSYHCCCGQHSHADGKASLGIVRSKNPKYGPWMVKGFAEACRFHRATDAFGVYCAMEGLTEKEAVKRIAASMGLTKSSGREPQSHPAPPTVEAVDVDGPRRPHTAPFAPHPLQADLASKIREAIWLRLSLDGDRTESERALMRYLLTQAAANETIWCQRSKEQIAAAIGYGARTIQVARRKLVAAGYLHIQASGNAWGGDESNWYRLGGGESTTLCDSPPIKSVLNDHGIPALGQSASESGARLRLGRGAIQEQEQTAMTVLPDGETPTLQLLDGEPPLAAALPSRSRRTTPVEIVDSVDKPRKNRSQRTKSRVDKPSIDGATKTRILGIVHATDGNRSLQWLTQLQREGLLGAAVVVLQTEAKRHFALGERTRGKKRQWQRTTIMKRLAEPCTEPPHGQSQRATMAETLQAQRLSELGVFPSNIERFAALPLATIDQAIRLARSIDGNVAKLTVAFLKRHLADGWSIPTADGHDAGLDMTKYTDGGKYAGFFTHISGDDDQPPHHARTL